MKKPASSKTPMPKEELHEGGKEQGGVQSIARAFAIAEEIARNRDGISLAELSKRVGLHNSTTFHLVKTMVQLGYVSQLPDSKRYRIGRRMFTLAAGALDEIELVNVATPVLEKLTGDTGEYSHFAIRSGEQIVVVAKTAGTGITGKIPLKMDKNKMIVKDRADVVRLDSNTRLAKSSIFN